MYMVAPLREERGPLLRDEVLKGQKFPVVIRTGGGRVCLVPIRERYFILGVFLFFISTIGFRFDHGLK